MNILAIETSCDETAAAVVVRGKIKANVIASQAKIHNQFGGVVPEVAAREHIPSIIPVIKLALETSRTPLANTTYIAVTQGPGLITSLMTGTETAQAMGLALNKPVIPVNHLEAHIYANFVDQRIVFPALALIVSGGHTLLVLMREHGKLRIVGETVDDAAGEAFDKTAKLLKLGYPGGPAISRLALRGNPKKFDFPRPMLKSGNLQFSFSGLKTAVLYEWQKHPQKTDRLRADLAASLQQAIVDVLISKLKTAILVHHPQTIMLGGGVAANELLRNSFVNLAKSLKVKCSVPKLEYCTDNAAMIGLAAYHKIRSQKKIPTSDFEPDPNLRLG